MKQKQLGDQQAMAYVRVGPDDVPQAAMADTGTKRSIVSREIAMAAKATPTGRTGVMHIAGQRLEGQLMRMTISVINTKCRATVDAFVPNQGQMFRKGFILGMDFLQKAKMRIDAETGEAYCPRPQIRSKR